MEKQGRNQRKKLKRGSAGVVVERRVEERRVDGGSEAVKRKKPKRNGLGDPESEGETKKIQNFERRPGMRKCLTGGSEENAEGEDEKTRKRARRQRSELVQSSNHNAAEGVGIYAGFTMFEPKKKGNHVLDGVPVMETSAPAAVLRPAKLLDKMRARLSGGRFRMLNETLYTCRGKDAYELFRKDPAAFTIYHFGYQEQMSRWPVLPVEVVSNWLRSQSPKLVVADFGCGDARLAKSIKNKVFSLDLMSIDPSVIACNMAHTPLDTSSVDVAVFCLSLMGSDYPEFIQEANRVLKPSGLLLIAEVRSRFDTANGGASPQQFIGALQSLGFSLMSQDVSSKMFFMFYLKKDKCLKGLPKRSKQWPQLKACIYKRR